MLNLKMELDVDDSQVHLLGKDCQNTQRLQMHLEFWTAPSWRQRGATNNCWGRTIPLESLPTHSSPWCAALYEVQWWQINLSRVKSKVIVLIWNKMSNITAIWQCHYPLLIKDFCFICLFSPASPLSKSSPCSLPTSCWGSCCSCWATDAIND